MDSDSDHFESADENFDSDIEETSHVTHQPEIKENKKEQIDVPIPELKTLKIEEKVDENVKEVITHEKEETKISNNEKSVREEVVKPIEIVENIPSVTEKSKEPEKETTNSENKKPRQIERKERPKTKTKLGVKLGTKIDSNKFIETIEETKTDVKTDLKELQKPQACWEDSIGWSQFEDDSKYSKKPEQPDKNFWEKEKDYMELPQKENIQNITEKMASGDRTQSSWGNWSNWGVSSILSTASLGVTTLTNSVSQGITTVLETGIGAPDPEELARIDRVEKQKRHSNSSNESEEQKPKLEKQESQKPNVFGLGNLVSGVTHITKLVETTGTKVLSGGLDTLEVIGKKTMEVLQEGDPGFKKKKAFLGIDHDKPVLSHVLREAKEKAEEENKILEQQHLARKANYETLFDDHQGLVHLEALEMLSKQCDIKLENTIESLNGNELNELQETLAQIKELCEIPDEDEDDSQDIEAIKEKLESAITELNVNITYEHLISTWSETEEWLQDAAFSEQEIHQYAIETLAKLTAISVEQFHKAGELLLVKERRSTVDEADSLVQLTTTLTSMIGMAAGKFSEKLNSLAEFSNNPDSVNSLITNIFLEAANSSSYIQDAFQLLIPVLQAGAV